ncbi:hypothetical protein AMTRI_Chr11g100840 [Amborella trichopoda]
MKELSLSLLALFLFKRSLGDLGNMAAELVNLATNEALKEPDWAKNIEICEIVSRNEGEVKVVIKSIKKRLGSKNPNTQLLSIMLLEVLMNNCGEHVHRQVIDTGLLPMMVKIVKKKSDLPVREKIFLLLDATQTALGGPTGKFPQYYAAYYDLVSARVQFQQRPKHAAPNVDTIKAQPNDSHAKASAAPDSNGIVHQTNSHSVSESSILQKARGVSDILREVLDSINSQKPEGATDEFTLDLVEQCAFHKQQVMHLVLKSQDEKLVSQAIELNDELQKVLARHDALLSIPSASGAAYDHEEAEEDDDSHHLFRRMRKGKACMGPTIEDGSGSSSSSLDSISSSRHLNSMPLNLEKSPINVEKKPSSSEKSPLNGVEKKPMCSEKPLNGAEKRPISLEKAPLNMDEPYINTGPPRLIAVSIPPPPAKHIEREKFFKERRAGGSYDHEMFSSLSLHSRSGSSSRSESQDSGG